MQSFYLVLANIVVALHIGYVSFVVVGLAAVLVGGLLGWRWVRNPWFRIIHLVMIGVVALETVIELTCPLTTLENYLRALGGDPALEGDFIGRMLRSFIFLPIEDTHWVFKLMYFGFAALVLAAFILVPPRWERSAAPKRANRADAPSASAPREETAISARDS